MILSSATGVENHFLALPDTPAPNESGKKLTETQRSTWFVNDILNVFLFTLFLLMRYYL